MALSASGKTWRLRDKSRDTTVTFASIVERLCRIRGIGDGRERAAFFDPAPVRPTEDLPNLGAALDRLERAIGAQELVIVYGDYDADGITAAAILVQGIREVGGRAEAYIPDRFQEGYGLNRAAIGALVNDGAGLLVAVDTGTSAIDEIAYANERAIDVIVLDHHLPKHDLPDAVAVVNPHLDTNPSQFAHLTGAGVAFMTLLALAARRQAPLDPEAYADLASIGTVCDMAPLLGANRAIVRSGLRRIIERPRPGLAALLSTAGVKPRYLTAERIGWSIGPRINATGRLTHAQASLDLLLCADPVEARSMAEGIEEINAQRRAMQKEAVTRCEAQIGALPLSSPLILAGDATLNEGVAGLVAGELARSRNRPALVYRPNGALAVGSARSIPTIDIHAGLTACAPLFERFGGHKGAAGFTIRTDRIEALREQLTAWLLPQAQWDSLLPVLDADFELPLATLIAPLDLLRAVRSFEPCGEGNPRPAFVAPDAVIHTLSGAGDTGRIKLNLRSTSGGRYWPAYAFARALPDGLRPGQPIAAVYEVGESYDGGPEFHLLDVVVRRRR